GTVGDIESQPFLEAARQIRHEVGRDNCFFLHAAKLSSTARKPSESAKTGVRSAKRTPSVGKSSCQRVSRCTASAARAARTPATSAVSTISCLLIRTRSSFTTPSLAFTVSAPSDPCSSPRPPGWGWRSRSPCRPRTRWCAVRRTAESRAYRSRAGSPARSADSAPWRSCPRPQADPRWHRSGRCRNARNSGPRRCAARRWRRSPRACPRGRACPRCRPVRRPPCPR
ncbi:hypothetical protein ACWELQ_38485, partial [Nocardia sp. NPDC004722]